MDNNRTTKTFVFYTLDAHGHVNSLRGLADALSQRSHRIIFVLDRHFNDIGYPVISVEERAKKEIALGNLVEQENNEIQDANTNGDGEVWANIFSALSMGKENAAQGHAELGQMMRRDIERMLYAHDDALRLILEEIKPDVIICDHGFVLPAIVRTDSPWKWVLNCSFNPLQIYRDTFGDRFPAANLGVSPHAPRSEIENSWKIHETSFLKAVKPLIDKRLAKAGYKNKTADTILWPSPYMNIYMFPKCLDYDKEAGSSLPNWIRSDSSIRQVDGTFEIPEKLAKRTGKLVLISMGTLASSRIDLMTRIVRILSKSPHRFIVAKGLRHAEFELADNMWGEKFVKQTLILPKLDGIITHGGNNTITESLHYGVPSILVTPMFWDQLDNATRIKDLGLGHTIDIISASDEEILEALETSLNDEEAKKRVKAASREIQAAKGSHKVATLLEMLVKEVDCAHSANQSSNGLSKVTN